ncbi:MAG: PAS domain-containing protein [Archangiaceae bacterium]|nr:PAS domain-containing protein [Archangiaceae bacterium]
MGPRERSDQQDAKGADSTPASIAFLARTFGASADVIIAADPHGRLLWCNRAPMGSAEPGAEVAGLFPPEFAPAVASAQQQVLERGGEQRLEWGTRDASGVKSWFSCAVSLLGEPSAPTGVLLRSTDLTALKRSEDRLRRSEALLTDTQGVAHLGTWEWDISQPHATWSAELYRIYGLTPETYTPSYEQYLTKIHPDDRQRVIDATNAVFHQHVPYSHDERIFRPDGSMRYLHTWAHPVLDGAGKLVKLVGVCQDITDRKLAEAEVLALNRDLERRVAERTAQLERSLQDLESFNAMVSHDLRNPLGTIGLSCEVIEQQRAELPARALEQVAVIRRSADRMGELIRDLLNLAMVDQQTLAVERVDLGALAQEIVAGLVRLPPKRQVDVRIAEGLWCEADPGLMRAALENLLGNAWKYTSKTPAAQLELGVRRDAGQPVFFVRDNGAGFDPAKAARLFQPFTRLHRPDEYPGTGVGLAAVHRIVARHGGKIWAEARPQEGATFFFTLGPAASAPR